MELSLFSHFVFAMPEVPTCESLQEQHFQSVLRHCPSFFTFLHKECFVGVVEQVVEQVVAVHGFVWQVRAFIGVGIESAWCAVHYHVVFLHHLRCHIFILYCSRAFETAYEQRFQPQ